MTNYIYFENATTFQYVITDQDGHNWGTIAPNGYYSIKLNYSPTFQKEYTFTAPNSRWTMWLGVDGLITQIYPDNQVYLQVQNEVYKTRTMLFGPPTQVPDYHHLHGVHHNKILITPNTNIFARSKPLMAPTVPDWVLRIDFSG